MKNYTLLQELLLRTPALSIDPLWDDHSKMGTPAGRRARLREIYQDEQVMEALFLGSPGLHSKCLEWLAGDVKDEKKEDRIELALLRYYFRMSTRCTPFGLFAGVTMARWEKDTNVELLPLSQQGRNTRLDMHYLCALAQHLEAHESVRPFLKFYPNSSIYPFGDKIRYIEYRYQDGQRHHQISAVGRSPYLNEMLEIAAKGAYLDDLAQLIEDGETSHEEAKQFVEQVIGSQLLVSELEPAITGDDLLTQMLGILGNILKEHSSDYLQKVVEALSYVQELLRGLDGHRFDDNLEIYRRITAQLDALGIPYELKKLFQADMVRKAAQVNVQNRLAGSIRHGLEVLNRLRPRKKQTPYHILRQQATSNLEAFQDAFFRRYETREMPLLEVLDNESGIGYLQNTGLGDTHLLIDDVQIMGDEFSPTFQLDERESFLLKKLMAATAENAFQIELSDEELKPFENSWADLPDTISVMGAITQKSGEDGALEQVYLSSAGGSSAANLLGRFTHADQEIDHFTKCITTWEEKLHPNVLFAEIIHLPEDRIGNILMRTQLRPYEIPFLARSSVPNEHQIRLQDLTLSVQQDRLFLWSKKLNKEIIPRLSTAHNYSLSSLPVYQFLCDLQFQQIVPYQMIDPAKWVAGDVGDLRNQAIVPGLGFSWGPMEVQFRFLPRVVYRNLILSRATWHLEKKQFADLLKVPSHKWLEAVRHWREKQRIPRRIVIADSDNELFIDLENNASVELFLTELKKRPSVTLIEFLFDPATTVAKDDKGHSYTNEFIMAFARKESLGKKIAKKHHSKQQQVTRDFTTGSEWLYYKFYTGAQSADQLLVENILPLTEHLQTSGLTDYWFFIRYADPDFHVRLRLHVPDTKQLGAIIHAVTQYTNPAFANQSVWKIQTDTYQREVERYGASTMELSERLFHLGSQNTLRFLEIAAQYEESEMLRWYYAMLSINQMLDCFAYDLKAKKGLFEMLKSSFAIEFKVNNAVGTRQLAGKYRAHQPIIQDIVEHPEKLDEHFPEEVLSMLLEEASAMRPICQQILKMRQAEDIKTSIDSYLSSLIHMLMNRLFRSQQRKYELVAYDQLFRGYQTSLMRKKG